MRDVYPHAALGTDQRPATCTPTHTPRPQVDRVAFTEGIVVAKCKHCDAKHLVADNLSKLDFGKGKVGPPVVGLDLTDFGFD